MVLTYTPEKRAPGAPVLGFVGKAVTFDTGGISIKPANDMEKMKFDMAGGAAMLGTMRAIAQLKPAVKVIAVIPSVENMPGGRAQKPGDVQIAMSGKSIEVINTDAEGPLDPGGRHRLCQAARRHSLRGRGHADWRGRGGAGRCEHRRLWHRRSLHSARAGEREKPRAKRCGTCRSTTSTATRSRAPSPTSKTWADAGAGAITAAWFLREFTGDTPWVHLDIAGTAWLDDAKPWAGKGGTGVGVRTLVDLAMNFDASLRAKHEN